MTDPIHNNFVESQRRMAHALVAANPELCEIHALPDPRFLVHFTCPVLVKRPGENPSIVNSCDVGITFAPDYCRRADMGVATMLTPFVFHPNIIGGSMCLGRIAPATPLADIIVQIYEMLVWVLYAPHDCLNPDAAQWVRNNPERVPLETGRPIRFPNQKEVHP